jgi:hypothetical protein
MILKQKWATFTVEARDTADLIRITGAYEVEERLDNLTDIVSRMIDKMGLSEKDRLELIAPYSGWEIVE